MTIKFASVSSWSLMTVGSHRYLWINFGGLKGSPAADWARGRLKELISERTTLRIPVDYQEPYPTFPISSWIAHENAIAEWLELIASEVRDRSAAPGADPA